MINLKEYREKILPYFILSNTILILLCSNNINYYNTVKSLNYFFSILGVSGVLYGYIIIFDSIITEDVKDHIIFFKKTNLPGNKIFSRLFTSDNYSEYRVSRKKLKSFYKHTWRKINKKGNNRLSQNIEWYAIYKTVSEKPVVVYSNENYLIIRDLNIIFFLFCLIYPFFILKIFYISYNFYLHLFFILMLIFSNFAARKSGRKFVNNVLVENYINQKRK